MLSTTCYLLYTTYYLLPATRNLPPATYYLQHAIFNLLLVTCYQQPAIFTLCCTFVIYYWASCLLRTRLGLYFLHHLFVLFAHLLICFTFVFELTCVLLHYADLMLGKGKLDELRALARALRLASGSQTVPNSVAEIAATQGRSPPPGQTHSEALPAQQRKKLVLRKPKRKAPSGP